VSARHVCKQDVRRWFTAVWKAQFWWPGNRAPQLTTTQALTAFHRQVYIAGMGTCSTCLIMFLTLAANRKSIIEYSRHVTEHNLWLQQTVPNSNKQVLSLVVDAP
jgi:hypothetical protein